MPKNPVRWLMSSILAWTWTFAFTSWCMFHLSRAALNLVGQTNPQRTWYRLGQLTGVPDDLLRMGLFLLVQVALLVALRRPITWLHRQELGLIDRAVEYRARHEETRRQRWISRSLWTTLWCVLLLPWLIQPTLVPWSLERDAWRGRIVNLMDGTASYHLIESGIGLYWQLVAPDQAAMHARTEAQLKSRAAMMDRWDPMIWEAAEGDPHRFAQIKAVIYVESRGWQFAVSPTGCLGLMQFCAGTARNASFQPIFGKGRVSVCRCHDGRCSVSRPMREALETGDPTGIEAHRASFPCELSDARFDPQRSIQAGAKYLRQLAADLEDDLLIMYVGYNSGPAVARTLRARVAGAPSDVDALKPHLADALQPYYRTASSRAQGLLSSTLPQLAQAYAHYLPAARATVDASVRAATSSANPDSEPPAETDEAYGRGGHVDLP